MEASANRPPIPDLVVVRLRARFFFILAAALTSFVLANCHRPDSWNGESVATRFNNRDVNLGVSAYHTKEGGILCQVSVGGHDPEPVIYASEIKLAILDQHGRKVPYVDANPPDGKLYGGGMAGGYTLISYYDLKPTQEQEPISATVQWEGETYTFRKIGWWDPEGTGLPASAKRMR